MKKPITLKVLVTVNDMAHFDACTLCFETLRVGWPTADIHVHINGDQYVSAIIDKLDYFHRDKPGRMFWHLEKPIVHLADWIRGRVNCSYPGPLIIADPDIVYWKSCEDWEFLPDTLFAGYWHPRMWNDFARCVSVQRIHTSMMVFPNTQHLRDMIQCVYGPAWMKHGEYCPVDPFMGRVMFDENGPTFWDCCANLYNLLLSIKGTERQWPAIEHFGQKELACYDHLNSASFYDCMVDRLQGETREGFKIAHRDWVKNPKPGLWPLVDAYYKQKSIEAKVRL
jgi:hypothetical protein